MKETKFPAVTICPSYTEKWNAIAGAFSSLDQDGAEALKAFDEMTKEYYGSRDPSVYENIRMRWVNKMIKNLVDEILIQSQPLLDKPLSVYLKELGFPQNVARFAYYLAFIFYSNFGNDDNGRDNFRTDIKIDAIRMKLNGQNETIDHMTNFLCQNASILCQESLNQTAAQIWLESNSSKRVQKDYTPYFICWQTELPNQSNPNLKEWCSETWNNMSSELFQDTIRGVHELFMIENIWSKRAFQEMMVVSEFQENQEIDAKFFGIKQGFTKHLTSVLKNPFPVSLTFLWDMLNIEHGGHWPRWLKPDWTEGWWNENIDRCFKEGNETVCDSMKAEALTLLKQLKPSDFNKILGLFSKKHNFIPLCSFSTKVGDLQPCSLFQVTQNRSIQSTCFTFNGQGEHADKVIKKLGPQRGLTVLLEASDFSMTNEIDFGVLAHEPGVTSDINLLHESHIEVPAGQAITISLKPTVYTTSDDFNSMSEEKRNCQLSNENEHYHQANCVFELKKAMAIEKCNCTPWDLLTLGQRKSTDVCEHFGLACYQRVIFDSVLEEELLMTNCKPACRYIDYSATISTIIPLSKVLGNKASWPWGRHSKTLEQYLWKGVFSLNNDQGFRKINPLIAFNSSYKTDRLAKMTLLNINFGEPDNTMIMQDAKVTFPDMIGNIGGTLGIFLGISMISLFDIFQETFSLFRKKFLLLK